ncbi:unnamed protein product, partial [Iphiclides podalirius]
MSPIALQALRNCVAHIKRGINFRAIRHGEVFKAGVCTEPHSSRATSRRESFHLSTGVVRRKEIQFIIDAIKRTVDNSTPVRITLRTAGDVSAVAGVRPVFDTAADTPALGVGE